MIDAAIVGLGWWGKNLVTAVQGKSEHLRFVRGVSVEPDPVRAFAAHHGLALSTSLAEVLRDPNVRVVVLATPHSLHPGQIVAAAEAGKAVFSEKPLALNRADAIAAVEACRRAGVPLGLGANKRFWPSMRELKRVVASGELGEILHVEGHYSNENSGKFFAAWRDSPNEAPGGAMTGTALHVLDAFVNLIGPVRRVNGQLVSRRPPPDPLDAISVLVEFANGASGVLASMRATPFYWRVHAFGTAGSAEAIGENDIVVRRTGGRARRETFPPVDSLRDELEAFAGAVDGRSAPPIPTVQMIDTVAAFEAVIRSVNGGAPSTVEAYRPN
ncbi:MAG TPA: Gfo/Idh/MocA family oxidoreductase [Reyranella sp.]